MSKIELTNMVMIQDKRTKKVLIQDRIKSWKGWSFPGGHVENNESFVDSAIREIKEETGFDISNLKYCGIIHWLNNKSFERYIIFLYKTSDFTGELITDSEEGKHFWVTLDEIREHPSHNDTLEYLPLFLEDSYSEAYGLWNEEESCKLIYK